MDTNTNNNQSEQNATSLDIPSSGVVAAPQEAQENDSPGPQQVTGGASSSALQSLRDQIEKKEAGIREKQALLDEKSKIVDENLKGMDEVRKELKEAQEEFSKAKEALENIEAEKKDIQPKYEHALANTEARIKADELKKAIDTAEATLKSLSQQTAETDAQLHDISVRFKEERESRQRFVELLNGDVTELKQAIEHKIAMMSTEATGCKDPMENLDAIENLTKERESEILNITRQLRELQNIIATKESGRAVLEHEGQQQIHTMTTEKDAEVRKLVLQIQQERDTILEDIRDVRVVNREQAYNLKRGQTEKEKKQPAFGAPLIADKSRAGKKKASVQDGALVPMTGAASARSTVRQTTFREEPKPSDNEIVMTKANRCLQDERTELSKKLYEASMNKADYQKSIKRLKEEQRKEAEHARQILRELELRDFEARQKSAQLEEENVKLEEACEALATTLQNTKKQFMQLRGKFIQAPEKVEQITAGPGM